MTSRSQVGHPSPCGPVGPGGPIRGASRQETPARGVAWAVAFSSAMYAVLVFVAVLSSGCAHRADPGEEPVSGVPIEVHVVQRGDTLYGIAWRHGLDYREIAVANGIGPPYLIRPGQRLRLEPPRGEVDRAGDERPQAADLANEVPRSTDSTVGSAPASGSVRKEREVGAAGAREAVRTPSARPVPASALPGTWRWPVPARPARRFGAETRWVEYDLEPGTRIRSASDGVVAYAGPGLGGFSDLVIVKASARHLVAYAMNVAPIVGEGDMVKSGDVVAELTGSGPERRKFRFEVRDRGKPVDPRSLITSWGSQAAA